MAETATKETRKRSRPRRNYAKDFERLSFYLETIIRIKDDPTEPPSDWRKGELKAYKDIQEYVGAAK
jgi:hypothetical protein